MQNYDNYSIDIIDHGNIKKGGMGMQIDQIILLILTVSWILLQSIVITDHNRESKGLEGFFTLDRQISCQIGFNFSGVLSPFLISKQVF